MSRTFIRLAARFGISLYNDEVRSNRCLRV